MDHYHYHHLCFNGIFPLDECLKEQISQDIVHQVYVTAQFYNTTSNKMQYL